MNLNAILEDHNPWWREPLARRAGSYPVRRNLVSKIVERVQRATNRRALLLMGPRQVGKTVMLLQAADELLKNGWPPANLTYFDFSDDRLTEDLSPRDVVDAEPVGVDPEWPRAFLLDEIRSASRWDLWLKQAVDRKIGRLIATDSAASLLRDGTRESGQGRWDEVRVETLSFQEFTSLSGGPRPELVDRYLALGGFPEYVSTEGNALPEARRRLRADIVDRAIQRDLGRQGVDAARVRDLFVYLVQESGSQFVAKNRANDLQADPRTVTDWLERLEGTLLVERLEGRSEFAAAKLRSSGRPKIYAVDPGLVSAFAPMAFRDEDVRGRIFEAAVFRHLRGLAERLEGEVSYFRKRDGLEVDFVLEAPGFRAAIEVTGSTRPKDRKRDRLARAREQIAANRAFLIHGGLIRDDEALPMARFLEDPGATILGEGAAK